MNNLHNMEFVIGTEDRLFKGIDNKWYWQARGTATVCGPFSSREDAERDYATV